MLPCQSLLAVFDESFFRFPFSFSFFVFLFRSACSWVPPLSNQQPWDWTRDGMTDLMLLSQAYPPSCCRPLRAACAWLVGTLCLVLSQVAPVSAQETSPYRPPPAAIEGYNRGRAHYQAGRYRQAVIELERALALDPTSPNLVYNVARVYELLGELSKATSFYERYRAMLPVSETEERVRVASILMRLQGARTQATPEPAGQPSEALSRSEIERQSEAESESARGVADSVFWLTAGVGAASLIAGGATGLLALRAEQDVDDFVIGQDGSVGQRDNLIERADRLALSSDVLLMVGTTFAVSSLLLYMLRDKPRNDAAREKRTHFAFGASQSGLSFGFGGAL
jgi:hypothetical protein